MACEPFDCAKCGQRHTRCTGHVDSLPDGTVIDLRPCHKWPRKGANVCQKHGGNAPQVIAATQRRKVEASAMKLLGVEGYEPIIDPYTALANVAGEIVKLKDVLLERVEEMDTLRSFGGETGEQIDVVFAAYERAVDRAEKILTNMARLDLEDRIAKLRARINSDVAATIVGAMNAALDVADVQGPTREVIVREFRNQLSGDSGAGQRPALSATT